MRRVVYWYLPLGAALGAALLFGAGFYSFLSGDTGKPVDFLPRPNTAATAAPQQTIAPIILGDSLARGAGDRTGLGIGGRLQGELQRRRLSARAPVNIAVSGARTGDLLRQLQSANVQRLIAEANVVIVSIGGNDLWGGNDWRNAPPEDPDQAMNQVLDRVEQSIEIIRKQNSTARIFFVGLYNPFAERALTTLVNQWNAKLIQRFSGDPNVTIVQTADLFTHRDRLSVDRFHPGDEGYALIARRIADAM